MIYKFLDPLFTSKIIDYKRQLLDIDLEKNIKYILDNLKTIPGIIDVQEVDKDKQSRFKSVEPTLEKTIFYNVQFEGSVPTQILNYNLEITIPRIGKSTLEFVINGVSRHPLFQLMDTFIQGKKSIRLVGTFMTIFFTCSKGWIGIGDKFTHIGNLLSYYNGLEWFLNKCNYQISFIDTKETESIGERLFVKKIDPLNNQFDILMENFLRQKIYTKSKFDTKDFWDDLSNSYKYRRFSFVRYFDAVYAIDIFLRRRMTEKTIPEELLSKYFRNDFSDARCDLSQKKVLLIEYLLNPFISEVLTFIVTKRTHTDKNRIVNVTDHLVFKMPELHHVDDHSVNVIHSISEAYKTSYSGPQGFSRKSTPVDLRNIHPSYFKKLDPIYTPDREQCGIINWMTIDSEMANDLRVFEESKNV